LLSLSLSLSHTFSLSDSSLRAHKAFEDPTMPHILSVTFAKLGLFSL
jgi:hypothetical protein